MKKNLGSMAKIGLCIAMALCFVAGFGKTAKAADYKTLATTWPTNTTRTESRLVTGHDSIMSYGIQLENWDGDTFTVSDIKISNSKVAKIKIDRTYGCYVTVIPKYVNASAKITYKLTNNANGESKVFTLANLKYRKYSKPFKKFTIGRTNLYKVTKKQPAGFLKKSSKIQKLSIKASSGYKITSIKYGTKKLKNGKKYKFNKTGVIYVTVQHKKSKTSANVEIHVM